MNFNEYQENALRTSKKTANGQERLINSALGLTGEAGEVADTIKKLVCHSHPFSEEMRQDLLKEAGDILWYLSLLTNSLGSSLETVAIMNVEKLKKRFPQGFSTEASINRVDVE